MRHNQRERWTIDQLLLQPVIARAEEMSCTEILRDLLLAVDRRSTDSAPGVCAVMASNGRVSEGEDGDGVHNDAKPRTLRGRAKAMSTRVPFMPAVRSTPTARRTAGKTYGVGPGAGEVSLFDEDGGLRLTAILRNRRATPALAVIVLVVALVAGGRVLLL
jgi:hypothetical protein